MSSERAAVLELLGVGKSYPMLQSGARKLGLVLDRLMGREPRHTFSVLQDVSFSVRKGESLGIVGVNGAGKSTLLKMIAGVVAPTRGRIQRHGRIAALLELGAGFHPEYTGRENIFLACALMGLNHAETLDKLDGIIEFSDIGDYIDQPIKHYSSGMVVRLGFAVATCIIPDILITDEVLAVGDESFQKKCVAWLEKYLARGGTLLLCSHSMYHIQKLCKYAIWIDSGKLCMQGSSQDVARSYLSWHEERSRKQSPVKATVENVVPEHTHGIYEVKEMLLNGQPITQKVEIAMAGTLSVSGLIYSPDGRPPNVAIGIVRGDGTPVYGVVSDMDGHPLTSRKTGEYRFRVDFTNLALLPGNYCARSHAMDPEGLRLFDQVEIPFEVFGVSREMGLCRLEHHWIES
ncbi:MAG: ABC transporter ATP-binding protein [Burkholderiaceae bacterium]|nr:ABC transporter ATP-binding protein [Burkholderiaceae bacterium]